MSYVRLLAPLLSFTVFMMASPAVLKGQQPPIEIVPNVGHAGYAMQLAFSPNGEFAATGGSDNTVKIWHIHHRRLLRTLTGHESSIASVDFSSDGNRLLSADSSTIRIWDVSTGRSLQVIDAAVPRRAFFAPDGRRVIAAIADTVHNDVINIWDASNGRLIRSLKLDAFNTDFAMSVDGNLAATSRPDGISLWDLESGVRKFSFRTTYITQPIALSPDAKLIAAGGHDMKVKLWDRSNGHLRHVFSSPIADLRSVAFSPDSRLVAAAAGDGTTKVWTTETGKELHSLRSNPAHGGTWSVAFSPDNKQILTGGVNVPIGLWLWDVASGSRLDSLGTAVTSQSSVAFSPDTTKIASTGLGRSVLLWDVPGARLLRRLNGSEVSVSVAFSPNGQLVAAGTHNKEAIVKVWDIHSNNSPRLLRGNTGQIDTLTFSPDGGRLLSGARDGKMKVWDITTNNLLRSMTDRHEVWSVAFSPDGARALSGGSDVFFKLWDLTNGRLVRTYQGGHEKNEYAGAVAFSPDGSLLLSGSWDKTLRLWRASDGAILRTFHGHTHVIRSAGFSSDGRRIISSGDDKTARTWDAETGRTIQEFKGHQSMVNAALFSKDGTRVLTASQDNTFRIWQAATGEELARFIAEEEGGWLVITPEGFFNGPAAKATNLLSIVRGRDNYEVLQVFQSLYDPDLVREKLLSDPNKEVNAAAKVINLRNVLDSGPAPKVTIVSSIVVPDSDVVKVAAEINDLGKGVGRVEWRVNGITAAVFIQPSRAGPKHLLTQDLALDPGDNSIEVIAYNASNLLAAIPARATVKLSRAVDKFKPTLHVLAIGINKYADRGWTPPGEFSARYFPPLGLAAKDAASVAEDLRRAAKSSYADVRLTVVVDEEATRQKLERVVDELAAAIHPRDTFIFFAAGHGISQNGRFFFIPQDYTGGPDPAALAKYAIGQERLQDWFANRIKAKRGAILLDTCESGALIAGHLKSRTEVTASEAGVGRLHEATGRPVLTAAAQGQFAYEGLIVRPGVRHGFFTWALLDALRNGDTNHNGMIELSELIAHVQTLVPKLARELGGSGRTAIAVAGSTPFDQTPRLGSRGEDFSIVHRLQ
jgi:WD40 repeat protein